MKNFNKIPIRKLKHNGRTFLWKRGHLHPREFISSPCTEKLVIYLEGLKNSPLEIIFKEDDNLKIEQQNTKWVVGHTESGVIWKFDEKAEVKETLIFKLDLNSPKSIVKIIDFYLENGWEPSISTKRFIDDEGLLKIPLFKVIFSKT